MKIESREVPTLCEFEAQMMAYDGNKRVLDLREIDFEGNVVLDGTLLTPEGTIRKKLYTNDSAPPLLEERLTITAQAPVLEQRGPYTVLHRQSLHNRFGMQFIHDVVVMPNNRLGHYYWSDFTQTEIDPLTGEPVLSKQAVLLFALINNPSNFRDPYWLLTKEFCYAVNEYLLEVPGGTKEKDETGLDAALREAAEEVGLGDYQLGSVLELTESASVTSRVNNPTKRFLVIVPETTSMTDLQLDASEAITRVVMPMSQVLELMTHPNPNQRMITDSVNSGIWEIYHFLTELPTLSGVNTNIQMRL